MNNERRSPEEAASIGLTGGQTVSASKANQPLLKVQIDGIPDELKAIPQWVGWRVKRPKKPGDKIGKVPIDPKSGTAADSTDSTTWGTFEQALAWMRAHNGPGIGFVFTDDVQVVGTDLDKCRDADTGVIAPWAYEIINELSSYTELSPTGSGVHVLSRGKLPDGRRRNGDVEMYITGRFFTVTGVRVDGTVPGVEERTDALARVHGKWLQPPQEPAAPEPPTNPPLTDEPAEEHRDEPAEEPKLWKRVLPKAPTDDELLKKAHGAKNGDKFGRLFSGDTGDYTSASEASLALCGMLAFWTGPDSDRLDRLFRRSGLMRPKWDEVHGKQTIGAMTIEKALEGKATFWTPPKPSKREWQCELPVTEGRVTVICEARGHGGRFVLRATLPNNEAVVDKFDITSVTGRERVATRMADRCSSLRIDEVAAAFEELASEFGGSEPADGADGTDGQSADLSDGELLASCVIDSNDVELFHTPGRHDAEAYATIITDGHRETWPVMSRGFRLWAIRLFREEYGSVPGSQAVTDGLAAISAEALFDGEEYAVALRIAEHKTDIWLDLGDDNWSAVRITAQGWTVIESKSVPVRFLRRRGMQALPMPVSGGSIDELRSVVNLQDDDAWLLFVCILVTYFIPTGPYVVLVANGEQGSAKSTLLRILRALIDPNKSPLRRPPKDERDLMIAANNAWVVGFDNISNLPPNLSDGLCTLATGGGFGTRQLYTDDEEKLFDAMRPVILNGIEDVVTRADLLDRSIGLTLKPIPDDKREEDAVLRARFESMRARVLGALLDAVVVALRNKPSVRFERKPRMADFAVWAVACAPAFGWSQEAVLQAININRAENNSVAIEASPIGPLVPELMHTRTQWEGTAAALLADFEKLADDKTQKRKDWPATPRALRGALQRIAPSLRRIGVETTFDLRSPNRKRDRLLRLVKVEVPPSTPSESSAGATDGPESGEVSGRCNDDRSVRTDRQPSAPPSTECASNEAADGRADGQRSQPSADSASGRAADDHAEDPSDASQPGQRSADGLDDVDGVSGTSSSDEFDLEPPPSDLFGAEGDGPPVWEDPG